MMSPLLLALASLTAPQDTLLVTAEWLVRHAGDPQLVILHVGPRAGYDSAHIPGARFVEMSDIAAPRGEGPILELPTPARLDSVLEAKGVSDGSRIVLYWDDRWLSPTTRVYLTLYWAGLGARTSILDGGLPAWRAAGGAVTAAVPTPAPGAVTVRPRHDVVVGAAEVAAALGQSDVALIDARHTVFYEGRDTNHVRPGHLPGARNVPFTAMVDSTGFLLPPVRLSTLFEAAGAAPGDRVVTYCHIGQQASLVWFAARLLGYDARLYDGSFTEWTTLPQYPVERTP